MLFDLLSTDMYASYNVKVAQVIGLHSAIYLNELININRKAIQKNKLNNNKFTIDRKYITERTTLEEDEQKIIEGKLLKVNILEKDPLDENKLSINITNLTNILSAEDNNLLQKVTKLTKVKTLNPPGSKITQRQKERDALKNYISTGVSELDEAFIGWIDGVYANPKGFLSKRAITIFQNRLNEYTNGNIEIALKILDVATINGYRVCDWAIDAFEREYKKSLKVSPTVTTPIQRTALSNETF